MTGLSPFWFVFLALVVYWIAYRVYGKWYERRVWKPDAKRTTPAHMYMDGVEFFPVNRYVLWGYQFKSVAALGPILGPFVAVSFGWLPALIWILLGNFFIGWLQDYGAIMLSVRKEGRSFGPISYEFTGPEGRNTLLGFILFYLIIISSAFIYFIALFWNIFSGTFVATLGVLATGVLAGRLLYKLRMNIVTVTVLAIALIVVSIVLGLLIPTPKDFLGSWTVPLWAFLVCVIVYIASVLPMPLFIQPVNYIAFFPTYLAILIILAGALLSPLTGIALAQPSFKGFYAPEVGPLWPMLFVAIACGAISGWHSLVSSSTTSKQLDVETDAHPVGAGAMLSEGLLALASLSAFMVMSPKDMGTSNVGAWVEGAVRLSSSYLGGEAARSFLMTFFGLVLVIYALPVQSLVTRFWRLVSAEVFSEGPARALGQKHLSIAIGLFIAWLFAVSGSWINLWLYFGGANQLLAGLALMLVSIHLARVKSPSLYTLVPAVLMILTTLAAILWEIWQFVEAVFVKGKPLVRPPLSNYPEVALVLNGVFILVGVCLFLLGLRMAMHTFRSYSRSQVKASPEPAGVKI
jgi:carbon starvation protein